MFLLIQQIPVQALVTVMDKTIELNKLQPKAIQAASCSVNKSIIIHDSELINTTEICTTNRTKTYCQTNFNSYDRSTLSEIDPDNNYIAAINTLSDTTYHNESI